MDKLYIEELEVYAFHGVNEEEKRMGQKFLISVELFLDLAAAGKSDDLTKSVNYAQICCEIEEEFKKEKYNLIEKAAEELAKYILLNYDLAQKVKVMIIKPWAPIGKPVKYVAVHVDRSWHKAYIVVGSNLGNKEENIKQAINNINESVLAKVTKQSKIYETAPVGNLEQDNFLNRVVQVKTLLEPRELMELLLNIEKELKRERIIKWRPRTVDLDIILYDDCITSFEEVIIPHPRMHERMFVLEPLCDIAPYLMHPVLNKRIYQLKEELEEQKA